MSPRERDVRAAVYAAFRETGAAPTVDTLAVTLGMTPEHAADALSALADGHALVLRPGSAAIWMAHPFSGVPTDVLVTVGGRRWFANCAWDGLAIVSLFGGTGRLDTCSPADGEPLAISVENGRVDGDAVAHFLVPAAKFWDDIGFT